MRRILGAIAASLLVVALVAVSVQKRKTLKESFVESLYAGNVLEKLGQTSRRLSTVTAPTFINHHRRFGNVDRTVLEQADDQLKTCDVAFIGCLKSDECIKCFSSLQTEGIDWASVTPETPCKDVVNFLFDGGHCTNLKGDPASLDTFCTTFDSCVVWDDDNDANKKDNSTNVDCSKLTECNWPGFHPSFIGNGVCHDGIGCYNSEVCGFDGGDCCEDTCHSGTNHYVECGMDGYACRDPSSEDCDPWLSSACPGDEFDDDDFWDPGRDPSVTCSSNQVPYRLIMYDSFGDGWDTTVLSITPRDDTSKSIFEGGLKQGAQGTAYICLAMDPTCYHVDVKGGTWGNEVSWEIKPMGQGTRAVADGGAPQSCDFSIAGEVCERTCNGKPNGDETNDPDYKTYKDMYNCMQKTCLIQVGACQDDPSCAPCFTQDAAEFCFANDKFNAALDCGICNCSGEEGKTSEFCQHKATPGAVVPPSSKGADSVTPRPCSAAETLQGSSAVMTFAKCSNFDEVGMMMTDFDENNFGALDTFEACAHSYTKESLHGGRTALGCMQILRNAIKDPAADDSDAPKDAISTLAELLYHNAEGFCECAATSSAEAPLCPSFAKFKTLLYESLDACNSLDEIDCDAWNEFYTPCKNNLVQMFGSVDFADSKQCDYVKDTCGGAGPFPAFRKLDCNREIPKSAWDFYNLYARSCMSDGSPTSPVTPAPTEPQPAPPTGGSQPSSPPAPDNPSPVTPKPYSGGGGGSSGGKPYIPSDDKPYQPKQKKKHRFLSFLVLVGIAGGAVYVYQKRRSEFQFVRYRRARNYGGDSDLYSGLSMESSTNFEPPTLPPTPSALDGNFT
jgi:hypothetical protein